MAEPLSSVELAQLRRQQAAEGRLAGSYAKSDDIASLLKQMQQVALAQYTTAPKQTVVLTDQTDLGERFTELGEKLAKTVAEIDSSEIDSQQLKALNELANTFKEHQILSYKSDKQAHQELLAAIKKLELSPVINTPEPKVVVQEREIDFKPLQDTIRENFKPPVEDYKEEKIDLDCYRAQDINNYDVDTQYVGFVNPDGDWYIIENKVNANKMRYVFGTSSYSKAFREAPTYKYELIDKAIKRGAS